MNTSLCRSPNFPPCTPRPNNFAHSGCLLSTHHSNRSTVFGTFSRDWAEEEEINELLDSLETGRISHKQGLLLAQKLLLKFPGQLEIQNFIANRLWSLEMRDESTDVREKPTGRLPPSSRPAATPSCALPTAICWG